MWPDAVGFCPLSCVLHVLTFENYELLLWNYHTNICQTKYDAYGGKETKIAISSWTPITEKSNFHNKQISIYQICEIHGSWVRHLGPKGYLYLLYS